MIQRIQSVFLGLIVIIVATLCSINILHLVYVTPETKTSEYVLNLFYFNKLENGILLESHLQIGLILIASIVIGLSIYILMNFKNRVRQMMFTQINMVAIIALIAAFAVKAYLFIPDFSSEKMMLPSIIGIALMLFMAYLNVRVFFLIKKDEDLVKSADRIR
jgi:drug/metabolite transporter (DMT)-like permease